MIITVDFYGQSELLGRTVVHRYKNECMHWEKPQLNSSWFDVSMTKYKEQLKHFCKVLLVILATHF